MSAAVRWRTLEDRLEKSADARHATHRVDVLGSALDPLLVLFAVAPPTDSLSDGNDASFIPRT